MQPEVRGLGWGSDSSCGGSLAVDGGPTDTTRQAWLRARTKVAGVLGGDRRGGQGQGGSCRDFGGAGQQGGEQRPDANAQLLTAGATDERVIVRKRREGVGEETERRQRQRKKNRERKKASQHKQVVLWYFKYQELLKYDGNIHATGNIGLGIYPSPTYEFDKNGYSHSTFFYKFEIVIEKKKR